jgi:hypothetical protein
MSGFHPVVSEPPEVIHQELTQRDSTISKLRGKLQKRDQQANMNRDAIKGLGLLRHAPGTAANDIATQLMYQQHGLRPSGMSPIKKWGLIGGGTAIAGVGVLGAIAFADLYGKSRGTNQGLLYATSGGMYGLGGLGGFGGCGGGYGGYGGPGCFGIGGPGLLGTPLT